MVNTIEANLGGNQPGGFRICSFRPGFSQKKGPSLLPCWSPADSNCRQSVYDCLRLHTCLFYFSRLFHRWNYFRFLLFAFKNGNCWAIRLRNIIWSVRGGWKTRCRINLMERNQEKLHAPHFTPSSTVHWRYSREVSSKYVLLSIITMNMNVMGIGKSLSEIRKNDRIPRRNRGCTREDLLWRQRSSQRTK